MTEYDDDYDDDDDDKGDDDDNNDSLRGIGQLFSYKLEDESERVILLTLYLLEDVVLHCGLDLLLVLNNAAFLLQMFFLAE